MEYFLIGDRHEPLAASLSAQQMIRLRGLAMQRRNDWEARAEQLELALRPLMYQWLRHASTEEIEQLAGPEFTLLDPIVKAATVSVLINRLRRRSRAQSPPHDDLAANDSRPGALPPVKAPIPNSTSHRASMPTGTLERFVIGASAGRA